MFISFHTALTVDKPADVEYPVVGTSLTLSCETNIAGAATYEWYKGDTKDAETGSTLTIAGDSANDGDYTCIALDGSGKKSARSPATNVAFKSKYLLIQPLLPK